MKSFPWQILLDWYKNNGKHDFPWRQYESNENIGYSVWLAEILLQQTQADRVIPFYKKILGKYPTIHSLATASYEEFFPYYQGLGYYSRARNLLKTAKIISEEYDGIFPKDKKILKKLPGIGEYTARAILAFGYNEPILAWDTNLETIFSRYYTGAKNIKLTEEEKDTIEGDFREFISEKIQKQGNGGSGGRHCLSDDEKSNLKSKAISERVGLPPDAFDTFCTKSMEVILSENEIIEKNNFCTFSTKNTEEIVGENKVRNINNALMDWARLAEPKTSSIFNAENYIFTESDFYITEGKKEIIEKKISSSFPTPDAEIIVTLHQDHKIYYSLSEYAYSPFVLAPSENRETRKYIQDYFRETFGLELSVRPIHRKWLSEDGRPYIAVNAQVQAGIHNFHIFSKKMKELQEKNK